MEFQRLMGIEAQPLFTTAYAWPESMPQYVLGHGERRRRIGQLLRNLPGLHLVGNAYEGVGIPDCVRLAEETAKHITGEKSRS
jgi:oxygen-dependent protoporphyrinogen oxidase